MKAKAVNPILNVSNLQESFSWFEKLGWAKSWEWGDPPTFAAVCSGRVEIFLCQGCQGGRGRSPVVETFGREGRVDGDRGVWMSIWVDNVDEVYRHCLAQGIEIAFPPTDMEWNAREMHIRHPDGHVFRIGTGIEESEEEGRS